MSTVGRQRATPDWRDFEQLVSRVERALSSNNVTVTSPDRVQSLVTRRKREVDASLRARVGSAELLITIECRKRKATQDVTWIEQLGCKKQAIGAARTIAVASTGFTEDAVRAARHYGIDLRVLSQVTDLDVQSWILPQSVTHLFKSCDLLEAEVVFHSECAGDLPASQSSQGDDTRGIDAPVFVGPGGEALSLNDLWLRADEQLRPFDGVPADDKQHTRRIVLQPSDSLHLRTPQGLRRVHEIKLHVALRWRHERLLLDDARVVAYGPARPSDRMAKQVRAEFESRDAPNMNIRLGMQFEPGGDTATLSIETLPGKRR